MTVALPSNCEFVVNFAPELSEAIAETKYLEKLGFGVRPTQWTVYLILYGTFGTFM